jgi:hypothetical protein
MNPTALSTATTGAIASIAIFMGACSGTTPPPSGPSAGTVATTPTTTPATAAAAPVAAKICPGGTTLTALELPAAPQYDVSSEGPFPLAGFTFAQARWDKAGKKLDVYISNRDWPAEKGRQVANVGEAYVLLSFTEIDAPVGARPYAAGSKTFGKPSVGPEMYVKGRALALAFEGGAEIVSMSDGKLCGTFALKAEFGSRGALSGTFVTTLPAR